MSAITNFNKRFNEAATALSHSFQKMSANGAPSKSGSIWIQFIGVSNQQKEALFCHISNRGFMKVLPSPDNEIHSSKITVQSDWFSKIVDKFDYYVSPDGSKETLKIIPPQAVLNIQYVLKEGSDSLADLFSGDRRSVVIGHYSIKFAQLSPIHGLSFTDEGEAFQLWAFIKPINVLGKIVSENAKNYNTNRSEQLKSAIEIVMFVIQLENYLETVAREIEDLESECANHKRSLAQKEQFINLGLFDNSDLALAVACDKEEIESAEKRIHSLKKIFFATQKNICAHIEKNAQYFPKTYKHPSPQLCIRNPMQKNKAVSSKKRNTDSFEPQQIRRRRTSSGVGGIALRKRLAQTSLMNAPLHMGPF